LEATTDSVPLDSVPLPDWPLALVVGNEVSGVDPGILRAASQTVHLPMFGTKTSLNVAVAMGAAVYLLGDRVANA
jgi:23S rRNA (guanosine2251-2'-O)-methyltransferase